MPNLDLAMRNAADPALGLLLCSQIELLEDSGSDPSHPTQITAR